VPQRHLPDYRSFRVAALVWSTALFGVLAALTFWHQIARLIR
jgi:hypothetical protein